MDISVKRPRGRPKGSRNVKQREYPYWTKLQMRMSQNRLTQQELAAEMGITARALSAKVNGRSQFKWNEVAWLCERLSIDNPLGFFPATKEANHNG